MAARYQIKGNADKHFKKAKKLQDKADKSKLQPVGAFRSSRAREHAAKGHSIIRQQDFSGQEMVRTNRARGGYRPQTPIEQYKGAVAQQSKTRTTVGTRTKGRVGRK